MPSSYLACALMLRGKVNISDVRRNIERLQSSLHFVHWNQQGWKTGLCSVPPIGQVLYHSTVQCKQHQGLWSLQALACIQIFVKGLILWKKCRHQGLIKLQQSRSKPLASYVFCTLCALPHSQTCQTVGNPYLQCLLSQSFSQRLFQGHFDPIEINVNFSSSWFA